MQLPSRLIVNPEILSGKPVIRGTRISAELILEMLAADVAPAEILKNYPGLEREDLLACLAYASQLAQEWKSFPLSA